MDKLTPAERTSANLIAANIAALQQLFPELVTEGQDGAVVNVDVLKELVGDRTVTDAEERFGLNWHGKRAARRLALTPSLGTLRPCPEESVDWETTQNLMIEGDNLEVLKLLQKSYAGKVKLIYIDPPYNTGKDFVYPDDYRDGIANYLEVTGQAESGSRLTSHLQTSGRIHSRWLSMMYSRLNVARNLLHSEGVLLISIDDNEFSSLWNLCSMVFGEECLLASLVWKSRQNIDNRTVNGVSVDHEYVIAIGQSLRGAQRDLTQYSNPDGDHRGPWTSANMVGVATIDRRPNLHYVLTNPATGDQYDCPTMGWRYDRGTMSKLIAEHRVLWPSEPAGRPRRKLFLSDLGSDFVGFSSIIGDGIFTRHGTSEIESLFGVRAFDFPKPTSLIASFVEQTTEAGDFVLDFFAGSGTTAHAAWLQNMKDGGARRWILVQIPECLHYDRENQATAARFCDELSKPRTIAEITKERLRRAGAKIRKDNPLFAGDLGFRVFKLDSTNLREWDSDPKSDAAQLELSAEHLKRDRSELDILYEVLLKAGYDLCSPVAERSLGGKTVRMVGGGVLFACLASRISRDEVEALATGMVQWRKAVDPIGDTSAYFRDDAFVDDVAKTNLTAILKQGGFKAVRSL